MNAALLLAVGGLTGVGLYLLTSRSLSRIVLGYSLLGHATVVALITAGGRAGWPPIAGQAAPEDMSNPLPQALTLTAIVISFGLTLFLLALARRQRTHLGRRPGRGRPRGPSDCRGPRGAPAEPEDSVAT